MTCFNKQNYKDLKRAAKSAGDVFVAACPAESLLDFNYNGIAVAIQPTIENSNGKMINVAVSYCSDEDKYKPKHGKYQAMLKLVNGEYIQVPLAQMLREDGPDAVLNYLVQQLAV